MSDHSSADEASNEAQPVPLKRGAPTEDDIQKKKRRRRTTSCAACQKSKARCDFDLNGRACRRCQALRISCSRRDELIDSSAGNHGEPSLQDLMHRLAAQEKAMAETQAILRDISSRVRPSVNDQPIQDDSEPSTRGHGDEGRGEAEDDPIWNPRGLSKGSAPAVVVRELGQRRPRNVLRTSLLGDEPDLIESRIIDENTADELIDAFFRYHKWLFYLGESKSMKSSQEIRAASSFLHTVCCANAETYGKDALGSSLQQKLQKRALTDLGRILLITPLSLEDMQGILIMTDNQLSPTKDGYPYVDSWILTGLCANHGILTINFSNIVQHIKDECATKEDREATRLWGAICLNHLQWAAATGRPSTIPAPYITQCSHILSFYEATMQDGMLLAEITLYSTLMEKLGGQLSFTRQAECLDLDSWKEKWAHILELPTASLLLLSYYTANLILVVRSLEDSGEGLSSEALSSTSRFDGSGVSEHPAGSAQGVADCSPSRDILRASVVRYAKATLESALGMSMLLRETLSINRCLCIGYASLIVAFYDEARSGLPDDECSDLLTKMEDWSQTILAKPWVANFTTLAKRLFLQRLKQKRPSAGLDHSSKGRGKANTARRTELHQPEVEDRASSFDGPSWEVHPSSGGLEYDAFFPANFPMMEDIFSGGFPNDLEYPWWT